MKRATMELGGHAPVIVFDDADLELAAKTLAAAKFRNAGQVCVSPTRFLVQETLYERLRRAVRRRRQGHQGRRRAGRGHRRWARSPMTAASRDGGPDRRCACSTAREVRTGGERIGNKGYFFEPTVLTDVPTDARMMNEEPFGPVAVIAPFKDFDEAMAEANRLPYGLAAYAFTRSAKTANAARRRRSRAGMMTINHLGLALPEVPFGGIKDSGYGSRGRLGGDRGLSEHEVRVAGGSLSTAARGLGPRAT